MTRNKTLLSLFAVFIVPLIFSAILVAINYTGNTTNKGYWMTEEVFLEKAIQDKIDTSQYAWHIVYITEDQDNSALIQSGIKTLNTKSHMAHLITQPYDNLTSYGKSMLQTKHIYLADPHLKVILSYPDQNIMDMIADLKKILKSVDQT